MIERECLTCGELLDAYTPLGEPAEPHGGDISICLYCGAIAIFTGAGNEIRYPTDAELVSALNDDEVCRARAAIRSLP